MHLQCLFLLSVLISVLKCETYQNALLYLKTNTKRITLLSVQNLECIKCKPIDLVQFNSNLNNVSIQIDTYYPNYYLYLNDRSTNSYYCTTQFLDNSFKFGENATYFLDINYENGTYFCDIQVLAKEANIYQPLIIFFSSFLVLALINFVFKIGYQKFYLKLNQNSSNSNIVNSEFGSSNSQLPLLDEQNALLNNSSNKKSARMKSIDVFRGVCLVKMMFANFGAGGYSFLDHAPWNGLHLADIVFPSFVFIMGISIPLSFKSMSNKMGQNLSLYKIVFKILKRTVLLFLFGIYTSNSFNDLIDGLRIMGVLQRFSISYFVCAILELFSFYLNNFTYLESLNELEYLSWRSQKWTFVKSHFKEILLYPIQWLFMLFFVLIWLLLSFLLPVENCPTGYMGPGGLHENASHFNCTGGAAGHIDRIILGEKHMYKYPTSMPVYKSQIAYDPEGLLGSLTSCFLTYLGVSIGHIVIHYKTPKTRILKFLFYGLFFALIGGILCTFSLNDGWIPINKNLWSLSFVLVVAGIALGAIILLYLLVDLRQVYSGTPFLYLGRNSISIYICHILLTGNCPSVNAPTAHPIMLAYAAYWIAIWTLLAYLMNKKKVFLNL